MKSKNRISYKYSKKINRLHIKILVILDSHWMQPTQGIMSAPGDLQEACIYRPDGFSGSRKPCLPPQSPGAVILMSGLDFEMPPSGSKDALHASRF